MDIGIGTVGEHDRISIRRLSYQKGVGWGQGQS